MPKEGLMTLMTVAATAADFSSAPVAIDSGAAFVLREERAADVGATHIGWG